jgi:hypothetical protein
MIHLSSVNFDKAGAFVKANARPLDVRLFEYYFEGGTAASVMGLNPTSGCLPPHRWLPQLGCNIVSPLALMRLTLLFKQRSSI